MSFTKPERFFVAGGIALGAAVSLAVNTGWIARAGSFPPFVVVLLGMAVIEIVAGLLTRQPPGTLISMPARLVAFALGVGVLLLLTGGLA